MDVPWSDEQMMMAQKIVMERFAMNCVAGHLATAAMSEKEADTTVPLARFNFEEAIVVDRETIGLHEPYSYCKFTKAQSEEFVAMQGDGMAQTKVVTTLNRAASSLARWHDVLFFRGLKDGLKMIPPGVEAGAAPGMVPISLTFL